MIKLKDLIVENEMRGSDDYYYHITLVPFIDLIKRNGLKIRSKKTVTNYREYSKGKIFLCDFGAINYWVDIIVQHGFHNYDNEEYHKVAIFRILKNKLQNVNIDSEGSKDCNRGKSYYVTYDIPSDIIEFVEIKDDVFEIAGSLSPIGPSSNRISPLSAISLPFKDQDLIDDKRGLTESIKNGKGWFMHQGLDEVVIIFENGHKLYMKINYRDKMGEDKKKWLNKAGSTWSSIAKELFEPELSENGNLIEKNWEECFKNALNDERLKVYKKDKNSVPIFDPINFTPRA